MSAKPMTQGERLARIEAILEGMALSESDFRTEVRDTLKDIKDSAEKHRSKTDADEAALEALKNKGVGLLIGVALAGGAAGATISQLVDGIFK